jgi:hypothetical protein
MYESRLLDIRLTLSPFSSFQPLNEICRNALPVWRNYIQRSDNYKYIGALSGLRTGDGPPSVDRKNKVKL